MGDLNALCELIDNDPDWSSDEEDPFAVLAQGRDHSYFSSSSSSTSKRPTSENEPKFEEIFGTPISRTSSQKGPGSSSNPTSRLSCFASTSENGNKSTATKFNTNSNYKEERSLVILEPYSRLRLFRKTLSTTLNQEDYLKTRNDHTFLSLEVVGSQKQLDKKNFWTCGALVKKVQGSRTSAKGNSYIIWEINDLRDLKKNWSVFLFGISESEMINIPVGGLVDLINPMVMDGKDKKLSVNKLSQLKYIGSLKDFGFCQSKTKNGDDCPNVVNLIDCHVCIHHAPKEQRKLSMKTAAKAKTAVIKLPKQMSEPSLQSIKKNAPVTKNSIANVRMELQGAFVTTCKRNPLSFGNHESIKFKPDTGSSILQLPKPEEYKREPLNLNPQTTRHLSESDRKILEALRASSKTSGPNGPDLPELIAATPTAGSRNFLHFMNKKQEAEANGGKADESKLKMNSSPNVCVMNRAAFQNMKKALSFVKTVGPIKKLNPNEVSKTKRKLSDDPKESQAKTLKLEKKKSSGIEIEFGFGDDVKAIINAKSRHEGFAEELQEADYFEKMEKKESVEKKMLETFSVPTKAVVCQICNYVATSQSDFCREKMHPIKCVRAMKRFFKCKHCGNRTMSLDRLPKNPCTNCKNSIWEVTSMGVERKGPLLPNETLAIRGDEEKFIGSVTAKLAL